MMTCEILAAKKASNDIRMQRDKSKRWFGLETRCKTAFRPGLGWLTASTSTDKALAALGRQFEAASTGRLQRTQTRFTGAVLSQNALILGAFSGIRPCSTPCAPTVNPATHGAPALAGEGPIHHARPAPGDVLGSCEDAKAYVIDDPAMGECNAARQLVTGAIISVPIDNS